MELLYHKFRNKFGVMSQYFFIKGVFVMINLENGAVQEFYADEAKMMILDILEEYLKKHPNELRRADVIGSILAANKTEQTSAGLKKRVKTLLQGYNFMNQSMESDLKRIGCSVMGGRKHYKIRLYGDPKYQVMLAKTGSDRRGGLNVAAEINKIMF